MRRRKIDGHYPMLCVANDKTAVAPAELSKRRLKELVGQLMRPHDFKKGDIARWKPGLKNRTFPNYGEPVVITDVLAEPIADPSEDCAASPFFREPLTIVIATLRDDDLLEYRVDGRRFELFD